jgi:uncharacterized Zn finger protein (UPF0148 family)
LVKIKNKWAKKCSDCGKIIAHWNKSCLCGVCYKKRYRELPSSKKKNSEYSKKYRENNKEKIREYSKSYKKKYIPRKFMDISTVEELRLKERLRYYKNRNKILKRMREYNSREEVKEKRRVYLKKKRLEK